MGTKPWLTFTVLCLYCLTVDVAGIVWSGVNDCLHEYEGKTSGSFSLETEQCGSGNWTYQCYKQNYACKWIINAPAGHVVMLQSDDFSLEISNNCQWDYLKITEGNDDANARKFCGFDPLTYISTNNKLTLEFKSDDSYEGMGFTMQYTTYKPDLAGHCNTSIIGGAQSGKIFNKETSDASCFYSITAPAGKVVALTLTMHDFGAHVCDEESLMIHAASTSQGPLIGKWCHEEIRPVLRSETQAVFIEYRNAIGAEGERFQIDYQFIDPEPPNPLPPSKVGGDPDCSRLYTYIDGGVLDYTAPQYKSNKHCVIVVRNTMLEGGVVQATFEKFHLEESDGCKYDSLKVQSGERKDSKQLGGLYCGKTLKGKTLVTNGNSLRLEFKTDESLAWFGFKVKISFVPVTKCDVCKKGNVCVLKDYEKVCVPGKQCSGTECENGGTCVQSGGTKQCHCMPQFTGADCSERTDGCSHHFSQVPKDMKIKKGDDIFPHCGMDGVHKLEILWFLNGKQLGEYDSKTNRVGTHKAGTLQIDDISAEYEGKYTCIARIGQCSVEHTFTITLLEACDAHFTEFPLSTTKRIGDAIMITCAANNAKEISWKYAEASGQPFYPVDTSQGSRFMQHPATNYLIIKDAKVEDEGVYQCHVETKTGCSSYKEATLTLLPPKTKYNEHCGITVEEQHHLQARIIDGNSAKPREFPWHVTFRTTFKNRGQTTFCGGSLISTRHVLTAAHCIQEFKKKKWNKDKEAFSKATVEMLFGSIDCRKADTVRHPESYTIHEDYNQTAKFDSDIAIITLDTPVEYSDYIRPICLGNEQTIEKMFFNKRIQFGQVTGCGIAWKNEKYKVPAKMLQLTNLPLVSKSACEEHVEEYNDENPNVAITVTENMLCIGYKDQDKTDTCGGDSGGAYVMFSDNQLYQVGVVSFGHECGSSDMYGFYTHVSRFFTWINTHTRFAEEECENCDWN